MNKFFRCALAGKPSAPQAETTATKMDREKVCIATFGLSRAFCQGRITARLLI